MSDAHKPCKVSDHLPMIQDSTYGEKPYYKLTCECGAVEIFGLTHGVTANTSRCYRCCGVAFGLRRREHIKEFARLAN